MSDNIQRVTVLSKTTWTPNLFSFTVTRPDSFKFAAGQFVRLGVNPSQLQYYKDNEQPAVDEAVNEDIFRAYSIVSSPFDEVLEFFSIVIPDGAFTSQLQHLQVGDELLLNTMPFGFLTLARYQKPEPKDLWLLATGTGLAPFLSTIRDPETYERFEKIIVVHGTRFVSELAYQDLIENEIPNHEFFGELGAKEKLVYYPTVTREDFHTQGRVTTAIESGDLFEKIGLPRFNPETDRAMLCGSPAFLDDVAALLDQHGLKESPKMGVLGDYVIERAFVEK